MCKFINLLFLSLVLLIPNVNKSYAGDKEEKEKITSIINEILKRKDIDKIKASLKNGAKYIYENKSKDLKEVLEDRDKLRALGQGSYEEVISNDIIINDDIAYVLLKTKFSGMDKVKYKNYYSYGIEEKIENVDKEVYHTIIFEKIKKEWKIVNWHMSEEFKLGGKN